MKTTTAGLALVHSAFSKSPLHIPNGKGEPFKTELVEVRSPEQTIKWNFWHLPDDDRAPHNHPWDLVEATIHFGGYTEDRYWLEGNVVMKETRSYKAGDVNSFRNDIFHVVTSVLPGTVTRMVCGKATEGNVWSYLDIKTGAVTVAAPDPSFIERLRALNRFLIPRT
jgi:hypothetical protein